jgi:hypothetical protein
MGWGFSSFAILRADNDDNGESAAGSRLAHLLQIMVTFWSAKQVPFSDQHGRILGR